MDKGKSSHASFVESRVTSHGIVDRNNATTKDQWVLLETIKIPLVFDKPDKTKAPLGWSTIEAWQTTEHPINEQQTGYQELPTKMTR
jgi:hypothetical protein